eukprot:GHVR01130157.1.p2 GENE.GHVR01130157.1~~GHVR01130157.1.p2  ORF type:complete len:247 (+),score=63.49 GHVR01130157.1:775-1515(+)
MRQDYSHDGNLHVQPVVQEVPIAPMIPTNEEDERDAPDDRNLSDSASNFESVLPSYCIPKGSGGGMSESPNTAKNTLEDNQFTSESQHNQLTGKRLSNTNQHVYDTHTHSHTHTHAQTTPNKNQSPPRKSKNKKWKDDQQRKYVAPAKRNSVAMTDGAATQNNTYTHTHEDSLPTHASHILPDSAWSRPNTTGAYTTHPSHGHTQYHGHQEYNPSGTSYGAPFSQSRSSRQQTHTHTHTHTAPSNM